MDRDTAVESIERDCRRIVDLVSGSGTVAVPTCPGWDLGRLADHLGRVYGMVIAAIRGGPNSEQRPARDDIPTRREAAQPGDWLSERLETLVEVLTSAPADAVCWNFVEGPRSPVGFWWRRQVHETLIHRVDAELAAGEEDIGPAEAWLAADGITEFLELAGYSAIDWEELRLGEAATVHLHATDVDGNAEWTVDTENKAYAMSHLKADVALRGPAWSLDRWLWRRGSLDDAGSLGLGDSVEAFGDLQAAELWRPAL